MTDKRKAFSPNIQLLLFAEVNGYCPNCPASLMYEKNGRKEKKFEIAHIYPLNPKPDELALLKNEKKLNADSNHTDNLICLCVDCHTIFDKPRTVEEYRDLVLKKTTLIAIGKQQAIWTNTKIESEIQILIDSLCNNEFDLSNSPELNYDPKTIDAKTNESITFLVRRSIHRNVEDYYHQINRKFIEIDSIAPLTTETISSQIRSHYLALRKQSPALNQKIIFDGMVAWMDKTTGNKSDKASEIIVSYFIQNCEIFE